MCWVARIGWVLSAGLSAGLPGLAGLRGLAGLSAALSAELGMPK